MDNEDDNLYILLNLGDLGKQPVNIIYSINEIDFSKITIKKVLWLFDAGDVSKDINIINKLTVNALIHIKNTIKCFLDN